MAVLAESNVASRLPAQDLGRARSFYAEKLGLEPVEERPGGLRYRCGSGEFALFESAGAAGIHLEDQQMPKRCGHLSGKALVEPQVMVAKIRAAVAAKRDPDFVLIARTDARGVTGFEDAVRRAKLYFDAGADAIFPEALESVDEFARFAREVPAVLLANMTEFGRGPLLDVATLGAMGYRLVLFPLTAFRVAMKAAEETLAGLFRAGHQRDSLPRMMTRAELYDLLGYSG